MSDNRIVPDKITKPFQLLAAWLTGLIVIDAAFLTAATQLQRPEWLAPILIVAAVVNVPLFLFCIFLLQTRFRPEMQEDTYYAQYLERKYSGTAVTTPSPPPLIEQARATAAEIVHRIAGAAPPDVASIQNVLVASQVDQAAKRLQNNRTLSELYLRRYQWQSVVKRWGKTRSFRTDLEELQREGMVPGDVDLLDLALTDFGAQVASRQQELGISFPQRRPNVWNRAPGEDTPSPHENLSAGSSSQPSNDR